MHGPDGGRYANDSIFQSLTPDACVVVEHLSPPRFTLTVTLTADDGGTVVGWEQSFPEPDVAERVRAVCVPANEQNLDRLAAELG